MVLASLAALLLLIVMVLSLRWLNPVTSAFMLEARAGALFAGEYDYHTTYHWVDLESISDQAALAVIASEDQNFPYHAGFDFKSIRQAVRAREHGSKLRGASTLTQQVAKNLFLWPGHSFARKGLEALCTVLIEAFWPKERILEVYLNVAEFGRGTYGVEAAAERYFHTHASRLTRHQGALLAAVLPNPILRRVDAPSQSVLERRDWILHQMVNLGGTDYLDELTPESPAR